MNYEEFLKQKKHSSINYGIEPIEITDSMFDFQKHITEYAIKMETLQFRIRHL